MTGVLGPHNFIKQFVRIEARKLQFLKPCLVWMGIFYCEQLKAGCYLTLQKCYLFLFQAENA